MEIHGIDRGAEQHCTRAAAQIGVAPEIITFVQGLPDGGNAMIARFVPGRILQPAEIRSASHLPQVIAAMQRYHALTDFAGRFDVFRIFERCLAFARQAQAPLPAYIDQVQAELQRIEAALQRQAMPLVACHNDLLPANFLEDAQGRLWLLDWEYAGWGDRFFDLGNLSVNNEFSDAEDAALLRGYFGQLSPAHWARLKLMKIVSDAREGIWGMVQWAISTLDFDYAAYGQRHLERFMTNCATAEVAQWLAAVEQEK
jgi:thiamine kinase-like enzyme